MTINHHFFGKRFSDKPKRAGKMIDQSKDRLRSACIVCIPLLLSLLLVHSICILGPADFILKHAHVARGKVAAAQMLVVLVQSKWMGICQQEGVNLAPKPI